jgi:hypothetical protein
MDAGPREGGTLDGRIPADRKAKSEQMRGVRKSGRPVAIGARQASGGNIGIAALGLALGLRPQFLFYNQLFTFYTRHWSWRGKHRRHFGSRS